MIIGQITEVDGVLVTSSLLVDPGTQHDCHRTHFWLNYLMCIFHSTMFVYNIFKNKTSIYFWFCMITLHIYREILKNHEKGQ